MKLSRHRASAFTLIELMMAIAVFALVMVAIYSIWYLIIHSTQVGQQAAVQGQRARVAIHTIEDSLVAVQSFQASMKYYAFVAESGDKPILSFVAHLSDWAPRNTRFDSQLRRLTFTLEGGDNDAHNLVLRQQPILMDMDADENSTPLIVAKDVEKFAVECWDPQQNQWVDDWQNTNFIPTQVLLMLRLGGRTASGIKVPSTDYVRLISIPSVTLPGMMQSGRGAGGIAPNLPGQIPGQNGGAPNGNQINIPGGALRPQ